MYRIASGVLHAVTNVDYTRQVAGDRVRRTFIIDVTGETGQFVIPLSPSDRNSIIGGY